MTREQINRAIAFHCGWTQTYGWWSHPTLPCNGGAEPDPPEYDSDLNAMHEAEKTLTKDQKLEYQDQLYRCAYKNGEHDGSFASWHYIHAGAKTRAAAFIETIKSK